VYQKHTKQGIDLLLRESLLVIKMAPIFV